MRGHHRLGSIDSRADQTRTLADTIDGFLVYCKSKNLSVNTITYYRYRLEAFRSFIDRHYAGCTAGDVTSQMVREFITDQIETRSPATANHSITALKSFFNYLVEEGLLGKSPVSGVKKVKTPRRVIETFSTEQIESLLAVCDKSFAGVRDRAIILTLYDCGIRSSELCGLRLEDVNWQDQTMLVRGKGDRERLVSIGQECKQALARYLARRPTDLGTDSFFVTCFGEPLSRYRLREIVKTRCKKAGVTGVRCSPHTLRHTFAVAYLRSGGDVFSLQKILGHSDLAMTRRYCELSQTDALERHKLHSPGDALARVKNTVRRTRIA